MGFLGFGKTDSEKISDAVKQIENMNLESAEKKLKKFVESKNPEAMLAMGDLNIKRYETRNNDSDLFLAIEYYATAVTLGLDKAIDVLIKKSRDVLSKSPSTIGRLYNEANAKLVENDMKLAYALHSALAEAGYVGSQYQVSLMRRNGEGVDKNRIMALYWMKQCADFGYRDAAILFEEIYNEEHNLDENALINEAHEAIRFLPKEAFYTLGMRNYQRNDYKVAKVFLAQIAPELYTHGYDVAYHYDEKQKHYPDAMYALGMIIKDLDDKPDIMPMKKQALGYFKTSADDGNRDAMKEFYKLVHRTYLVDPSDLNKAKEYYQTLQTIGADDILDELKHQHAVDGIMYRANEDLKDNLGNDAVRNYTDAANSGSWVAAIRLSMIYAGGLVRQKKDTDEAISWWEHAIRLGGDDLRRVGNPVTGYADNKQDLDLILTRAF